MRGLGPSQDLDLGEEMILDAIRCVPLQCGLLALMGYPLTFAGCLYLPLIQLLLEAGEYLKELALGGKLSYVSVASRLC